MLKNVGSIDRIIRVVLARNSQIVSRIQGEPTIDPSGCNAGVRSVGRDPIFVVTAIYNPGQRELFVVVQAGDALRLGFRLAQGRQQYPGENRDDGDHHEQFDQRECTQAKAGCI